MITGQITCHCGQDVPGYLAHAHVKPSGASCVGIREELHKPTLCLDCRNGTHGDAFLKTLAIIRWERYGITV